MRFFPLFFRLVHRNCLIFGLSTNWSLRPQESRSFVRTSVRSCVTLFLGNRSLLFYETLQLARACKREKNFPIAFLIIFTVFAILVKKWPKLAFLAFLPKITKNIGFTPVFSRTAHQNFLIFCLKHSLWSLKIITFSLFGENFKNSPFWPKLTQIFGSKIFFP